MEEVYQKYSAKAQFFLVYIREAHPIDGWMVPVNERERINVTDPTTHDEREEVATECVRELDLSLPTLIDDMEDTANKSYAAWPDRIFIIGKDGKIFYAGGVGPRGFSVDDLEENLKRLLKK